MSEPVSARLPEWRARFSERMRGATGRRVAGMALAIAFEGLIVLLLLSFAGVTPPITKMRAPAIFGLSPEPDQEVPAEAESPEPAEAEQPAAEAPAEPLVEPVETPPARPAPLTPAPQAPSEPQPEPFIRLTRDQMAAANIRTAQPPARGSRPVAGPADPGPPAGGAFADTPRVAGAGPNGEPLYAASWYREPTRQELAGYLSTANGPGWALVMCRTVAGYRVEDCELIDETPGSNIGRAVLAATWQFRVRPPMLGGRPRFGEWVRIRIDYTIGPG